jgi:hypothetical protein
MDLLNFEDGQRNQSRFSGTTKKQNKACLILGVAALLCFIAAGCGMRVEKVSKGTRGTKIEYSPLMYQERPVSIVVLPIAYARPETKKRPDDKFLVDAVSDALRSHGYEVIAAGMPPNEDLPSLDSFLKIPVQRYRDDFKADAVLYTVVERWHRHYEIAGYKVRGAMVIALRSTKTGQVLWQQGIIVHKGHIGSISGGGIYGFALIPVEVALNVALLTIQFQTGLADSNPSAKEIGEAMQLALESMPYGRLHELYGKDMDHPLTHQNRDEETEKKNAERKAQLEKNFKAAGNFFKDTMSRIKGQGATPAN